MKIVLTKDVYKKGVAGEVVTVADGYARNYLIPYGMAVKATAGAYKQLTALRQQSTVRREQRDGELNALAEQLEGLTLSFPVKAGEAGKLYGSVTNGNMGEAIQAEINIEIDRRRIGEKPLRELGEHSVVVRLSSGLTATIRVLVYREGDEPESAIGVVPGAGNVADFDLSEFDDEEAFDASFAQDAYAAEEDAEDAEEADTDADSSEDDDETVADTDAEEADEADTDAEADEAVADADTEDADADMDADSDEAEASADSTDDEASEADALDDTETE